MAKHKQETKQRKGNKHTQGHTRRWGSNTAPCGNQGSPARISGLINEARAIWRWTEKQSQCVKQLGLLHHQSERRECQTADVAANHSVSVLLKLLHFWISIVFCPSPLPFGGLRSWSSRTSGESNHHQHCSDTRLPRYQFHEKDDCFWIRLVDQVAIPFKTCTGEDNLPKSKIYFISNPKNRHQTNRTI